MKTSHGTISNPYLIRLSLQPLTPFCSVDGYPFIRCADIPPWGGCAADKRLPCVRGAVERSETEGLSAEIIGFPLATVLYTMEAGYHHILH